VSLSLSRVSDSFTLPLRRSFRTAVSLLTSINRPLVTESHHFSHSSTLGERQLQGPQVYLPFSLHLSALRAPISHFSLQYHFLLRTVYSSALKIKFLQNVGKHLTKLHGVTPQKLLIFLAIISISRKDMLHDLI
jgi:hypothetical protein